MNDGKPTAITATDLRAALLKHYGGDGWRVLFEVSNDTGARAGRWIDAMAFGLWPSTGHERIGIEIKVSRGDWKRELATPEKAQALMRYCTRWFVAAPFGLIKPDELPGTWGMLSYKDGAVKMTTPAPRLEPEPITPGFMMACMRMCHALDPALIERRVAERVAEARKSIDREIEYGVSARVSDNAKRTEDAALIAAKLTEITGEEFHRWGFEPEALGAAYRFLKLTKLHANGEWGGVPAAIAHLEAAAKLMRALAEQPLFLELRKKI